MSKITNVYPVHVCAAGLCVWSCRFVCVRILENLLPSVFYCYLTEFKRLQCVLLRPASRTSRAIHRFLLKQSGPPALQNCITVTDLSIPRHARGCKLIFFSVCATFCCARCLRVKHMCTGSCVPWNSSYIN